MNRKERVMQFIEQQGVVDSVSLAKEFHISRTLASATLKRLEDDGRIRRTSPVGVRVVAPKFMKVVTLPALAYGVPNTPVNRMIMGAL